MSHVDEQEVLVAVMSQAVGFLFRLATLVKAPEAEARWSKALAQTEPLPDSFDYNHIIEKYPKLDFEQGRLLARRLSQANVKRRQFIQYCADNSSRLSGKGKAVFKDVASEYTLTEATALSPGTTQETRIVEDTEDTESFLTDSTTFEDAGKLRLPPLESLSPDGEPFQCPICFTLQQPEDEKSWKRHAFCDIGAYCCTFGGEKCDSELFGDRQSWFEHETSHHRSHFTCILCNNQYPKRDAATAHVESSHGSLSRDQISVLVDSGRTAPTSYRLADCPFCDWVAERRQRRAGDSGPSLDTQENQNIKPSELQRHVAMHQEQLVLFVVPLSQPSGIGGSEDDGSHGETETEAPRGKLLPAPARKVQDEASPIGVAVFAASTSTEKVVEQLGRVDISEPLKDETGTKTQTREEPLKASEALQHSSETDKSSDTAAAVRNKDSSRLQAEPEAASRAMNASGRTQAPRPTRYSSGRSSYITVWSCVSYHSISILYVYDIKREQCRCGFKPMNVATIAVCLNVHCEHQACLYCPVEFVKNRSRH